MAACASLMVLSEPIIFNIQMLITHLIMVISLSHTHICVQHLKDYNFGQKKFSQAQDPNKKILILFFIMLYKNLILVIFLILVNTHARPQKGTCCRSDGRWVVVEPRGGAPLVGSKKV